MSPAFANKPPGKVGMTSLEAAALYLSDGETKDINKAALVSNSDLPIIGAEGLDLDAQQRAQLREMMGFDFKFKEAPNKLFVMTTTKPHLSAWCKFSGKYDEPQIMKLVDACLRLKLKHDKLITREPSDD